MSPWLRLARVSNLSTIASNVLCGVTLAGADAPAFTLVRITVGMAALYTGMFLDDAFDRRWDRIHRPERPLPRGEIHPLSATTLRLQRVVSGS